MKTTLDPIRNVTEREFQGLSRLSEGTIDVWGHCAPFCRNEGEPRNGASIEDHGHYCMTPPILTVSDVDDRLHTQITVERPYFHGRYDAEQFRARRERLQREHIELDIHDDDCKTITTLRLAPGEVRRLVAGLIRAVDIADGLATRL